MNALQINELESIERIDTEDMTRFKITDLSSLNWALRKLAAINAKKIEIDEMIKSEISRLEHFKQNELSKLTNDESYFNVLIEEYAVERQASDSDFRDVTPYGSVTYHKQQPKWNYDDTALVEHLEQNGLSELVRITKEPMKAEIKKKFSVNSDGKVYDQNAEEVVGIKVETLPDKLVVKVGE